MPDVPKLSNTTFRGHYKDAFIAKHMHTHHYLRLLQKEMRNDITHYPILTE